MNNKMCVFFIVVNRKSCKPSAFGILPSIAAKIVITIILEKESASELSEKGYYKIVLRTIEVEPKALT